MIAAPLFLRHFASDRSHMLDGGSGGWLQPPPAWPCIVAADGGANTLPAYLAFPPADAAAHAHADGGSGSDAEDASSIDEGLLSDDDGGLLGAAAAEELLAAAQQPLGVVLSEPAFLRLFGVEGG